jgi:hypothetical protein
LKGKRFAAAVLAAAAFTVGSFALSSSSAFAKSSNGATNGTTHCALSDPSCGANPALTGPPPPFVTVASNCPSFVSTDAFHASGHGTINNNGTTTSNHMTATVTCS